MLLTVSTTRYPATDLGWLLHKHPQKVQAFELAVGHAHVFYPEATEDRCTAALVLDVDPVGLGNSEVRALTQMGVFVDSTSDDRNSRDSHV